jgi:hypothetical protein
MIHDHKNPLGLRNKFHTRISKETKEIKQRNIEFTDILQKQTLRGGLAVGGGQPPQLSFFLKKFIFGFLEKENDMAHKNLGSTSCGAHM